MVFSRNSLVMLVLTLLSAVPLVLFAQSDVVIQGKANQGGIVIRLIVYEDYISGIQRTIAVDTTDLRGRFEIRANLKEPTYAQLVAGPARAEIFILPSERYVVQINDLSNFEQGSYFDQEPLRYELISSTDKGASNQITTVNLIVNTFILQHFNDLYKRGRHGLLDSLRQVISRQIPNFQDNYISIYTDYKIAALRQSVNSRSWLALAEQYFVNKPVYYNNVEYMAFFTQIFQGFLLNSLQWNREDLKMGLSGGLNQLFGLLNRDALLRSDNRLAELILLYNLKEMYFMRDFGKQDVIKILNEFATRSNFPEHRVIAANIIKANGHLGYFSEAPPFMLPLSNGSLTGPADYPDHFIILNFVKTNCQPCVSEYDGLQKLLEKYTTQLKIITIATAESYTETNNIFRENRFDWMLVNLSDNWTVLEDYNIRAFPEFVVVLPGGRIGMAPAPSPEEGLEMHLQRLMKLSERSK